MALSFARSARGVLEQRVRCPRGIHAMRWPHHVWTLDSLHRLIIHHLLRSGLVEWPGGHEEVSVVESWRGHSGSRQCLAGSRIRGVTLDCGKGSDRAGKGPNHRRLFHPDRPVSQAPRRRPAARTTKSVRCSTPRPLEVHHCARPSATFSATPSSRSSLTRSSTATKSTCELSGSPHQQESRQRSLATRGKRSTRFGAPRRNLSNFYRTGIFNLHVERVVPLRIGPDADARRFAARGVTIVPRTRGCRGLRRRPRHRMVPPLGEPGRAAILIWSTGQSGRCCHRTTSGPDREQPLCVSVHTWLGRGTHSWA